MPETTTKNQTKLVLNTAYRFFSMDNAAGKLAGKSLLVILEGEYRILKGQSVPLLQALIDGTSVDDLPQVFSDLMPPAHVWYAIRQLQNAGFIIEDALVLDDKQANRQENIFWHGRNQTLPSSLVKEPDQDRQKKLFIHNLAQFAGLDANFTNEDFSAVNDAASADVHLVITADYLHPDLSEINKQLWNQKKPWLMIKPMGKKLFVGPLIVPDETACYACLENRLWLNSPARQYLKNKGHTANETAPPAGGTAETISMALNFAQSALRQWFLSPEGNPIVENILVIDTGSFESKKHQLVRRPQCKVCNQNYQAAPTPVIIKPIAKKWAEDGGFRAVPPAETFKKYEHHISNITGVVNNLQRLKCDQSDMVISVLAGHNMASNFEDGALLSSNLRKSTGGKGRTELQARTSALCEAIERMSGTWQGEEYIIRGSYNSLGEDAIHPRESTLYSDHQMKTGNKKASSFTRVPGYFDEDTEMDWTPLWSLRDQKWRYFPSACAYFGHPEVALGSVFGDSNGCAAGNTIEEAILQGFFELVERDAIAIWWYNKIRRPAIELASLKDPWINQLVDEFASFNRTIHVLDITTDLEIPSFVAVSRRTDHPTRDDIVFGFGSHFDVKIAASRSITELNQMLPKALELTDNAFAQSISEDDLAMRWWNEASFKSEPWVVPIRYKTADEYSNLAGATLKEDVETCIAKTSALGLDFLVQDQTRPDIGLPVVRVMVPGMRHFWQRLAAGRLYDIPVSMGWLKKKRKESELNQFPTFF